jgi:TetR/AcrR family transcriptional repressor of nem operon
MPRRKIERKDLLKASLRVFKEKGYHNTRMSDIADACGLLKGSLYHYVSGKEELMIEVLQSLRKHYNEKVFSIAYQSNLSPIKRLRALANECEKVFLEENGGDFMMNIGLETLHVVERFTLEIRAFYEDWILSMEHLYGHVFKEEDAREKAEIAVEQIEGAVLMMQMYGRTEFLTRVNNNIIRQFELAGLPINEEQKP